MTSLFPKRTLGTHRRVAVLSAPADFIPSLTRHPEGDISPQGRARTRR